MVFNCLKWMMDELMLAGMGPRGTSMLVRAAKVSAWLDGRLVSCAARCGGSVSSSGRASGVFYADL